MRREIGRRMNIKDIPSDYDTFERFNVQYGRDPFACTPATAAVATATRDMFLGWFLPKFLYPVGAPFLHAMLDDRLLDAFGFPKPPAGLRWLVSGLLRTRGRLLRLLPERRGPRRPTYPNGYRVEELGPNLDTAPTPMSAPAAQEVP